MFIYYCIVLEPVLSPATNWLFYAVNFVSLVSTKLHMVYSSTAIDFKIKVLLFTNLASLVYEEDWYLIKWESYLVFLSGVA